MTTSYPVTYAKGDQRRTAHVPADAARLKFDGFHPVVEADNADYRDLQAQAKELGIPASGTKEELADAINAKLAEPSEDDDNEPETHEGDKTVDTVGTTDTTGFLR